MKKCPECGLHNPEFINMCTSCGTDLNPEKSKTLLETRKKAKEQNFKDTTFSTTENKYHEEGYTVPELKQQRKPSNKNKRTATLISIVGGLFSLSGLGLLYIGKVRRFVAELFVGILLFLVLNAEITSVYLKLADTLTTGNIYLRYGDLFAFTVIIIIYILWWAYTSWDTYRCTECLNTNRKLPKLLGVMTI